MRKFLLLMIATCCLTTTMYAQDNWKMRVTMKSGEVKDFPCDDVKDVTFSNTNSNSYHADVAVTNTYNIYYGSVSDELAAYTLHLCDGKLSKGGLPTEINKHDIRVTILAKPSLNPNSAALTSGNYTLVDNTDEAGVYHKQSVYIETNKMNANGQVDGFLDSLTVCNLKVEQRPNGTYNLLLEGELKEHGKIRFTYDGKLDFVNKDPDTGYQSITENVDFKPKNMSGRYVRATDSYCDYSITFLNCETDAEGFIVGAGEYLNLVLLTEYKVPMDINTIVGTYSVVMPVTGAVYEQGKFIGGTMFKRGNTTYPVGSYYKEFDGQGGEAFGLFNGGTITVTQNNGDITFKGNWTTPEGKNVKMDYTANVSNIIDQSQQQTSANANQKTNIGKANNTKTTLRTNINDVQNAGNSILMIKN